MTNIQLPKVICAAVGDVLVSTGASHDTLDRLFEAAGAPGPPPPGIAHHSKWKEWLSRAGKDPDVDSLAVLGNVIEEFMDIPPLASSKDAFDVDGNQRLEEYKQKRKLLNDTLEEFGFRYFRGGRVLPNGEDPLTQASGVPITTSVVEPQKPSNVEDLLQTIIRGLPRAMHPLEHRRKGSQSLTFDSEYDIQDLLHSHLRPWIADIRPEEHTPSYAGTSTRMDFLLPEHKLVLETKRIRDKSHASRVGDELIIDIEHYRRHPDCERLWCVVYDPRQLIQNPSGLTTDLEGNRATPDGSVIVKVLIFGGSG